MKKIIVTNGIVAGVISIGMILISMSMKLGYENGMLFGYASMILAFSLIFVGIKNYRDKHNNGVITFGKAFKIGLFIALIASTIYVVVWLFVYFFFMPDYLDSYNNQMVEQMKQSGASQEKIAEQIADAAEFMAMYKNPFFNALITYTEILPVGLIISLIAAAILKRKSSPEPQSIAG
jgi:hypothetical protein